MHGYMSPISDCVNDAFTIICIRDPGIWVTLTCKRDTKLINFKALLGFYCYLGEVNEIAGVTTGRYKLCDTKPTITYLRHLFSDYVVYY